ncbi:DUF1772 domain-containing protein [Mycolicibacterium sp. HK-90]|uniref:DUF1772 domain-containing protein n=1 Tax=Mycolicibacterium sp. HK-90 TaxID=3056937 RepID=UPI0026580071|nr:DUF1772 domain-containing protein [Mycolicibacterium sp. HK-90]WKG04716.1 DUF1772 domain-containing protein [Mycolicibacterium sp. HK-90]
MTEIVQVLAVLSVGSLIGVEFAVTAFFHPILERLPEPAYAQARSASARILGRVMPFWYGVAVLSVVAAAVIRPGPLVIAAVAGLVLVMLLTLAVLVPINNRVGAWSSDDVSRAEARRWDRLHWVRVGLLAVVCVLLVLVAGAW